MSTNRHDALNEQLRREIGSGLAFEERLLGQLGTMLAEGPDRIVSLLRTAATIVEACHRHPEWVMAVSRRYELDMSPDDHAAFTAGADAFVRWAFLEAVDA